MAPNQGKADILPKSHRSIDTRARSKYRVCNKNSQVPRVKFVRGVARGAAMKSTVINLVVTGLLAALPLAAIAQSEAGASCGQVEDLLAGGAAPSEVISAMVKAGKTLAGATVFAMECADQSYRVAIAEAGVALAANVNQARGVATAVAFAAGESAAETVAARKGLDNFVETARPPAQYKSDYTPHGGREDVSPSS